MSRLLKGLALLVAVACFTWVAVLWHWQSSQHDMSVEDIGIYLVALPLTLFALALTGRWAWQGVTARAHEREAAATASANAGAAQPPSMDEAEQRASVQLLAAGVNCPAGNSPAAVLAAAHEGKPRPGLDPQLRDDDGLPLMTARIGELDLDNLGDEALAEALRARGPDWQQAQARPQARRALAALKPALGSALAALEPLRPQLGLEDKASGRASNLVLRVLPAWPADFTEFERALADDWLMAQLLAADLASPQRIVPVPSPAGQAWPEAERVLRLLEREGRQDPLLVTACHSAIGETSVHALAAQGRLFTTRNATGSIPGEAGVALVLAPHSAQSLPGAEAPPVRLHRAVVAMREKPVDAGGRSSNQVALACIEGALACGPFKAGAVTAVVHDADQHTPRAAEALTAVLQQLPHLAPADDARQTGALNGDIGAAAPLLVVALAAHQAASLEQPCLALSVCDAQMRLALVVRPAGFDPAAESAATPAAAAA